MGRVTSPFGLQGDVKIEPHSDSAERFSVGSVVHVDGRPTRIVRSRHSRGLLVVKLDRVNDRTAAESLRGAYLTVPRSDVEPLPEGSYYYFQIIGIGVWSEDGEYLGEVKEILRTGSNDVYVVRLARRDLLVPALRDVVLQVSLEEGKMIVRLPEVI